MEIVLNSLNFFAKLFMTENQIHFIHISELPYLSTFTDDNKYCVESNPNPKSK